MGWIAADEAYDVSLANGRVTCRTRAGKVLKAVPKAVRDSEAVAGLRQLRDWMARHDAACLRDAEDWMIRSLPVPAAVLVSVWPDPSWQAALRDLVVVPVDADGAWQLDAAGFLRAADADGIGMVNLEGDSVRVRVDRVVIPHPVLLEELDDLREFAADLGIDQGVLQLFREIWRRPADPKEQAKALSEYSGGHFAQLRHLTGRALAHGYNARGGSVSRRLWDAGRLIDAQVWTDAGDPSEETETGDLAFTTTDGAAVPPGEVGPVAWSEGMRMAATLFAGRVVPKEDAAA
jgi:hypothetical protein